MINPTESMISIFLKIVFGIFVEKYTYLLRRII